MLVHPVKNGHRRQKIHVLEVLGNAIVGGMETYVRNLVQFLPSDLFEVICLCPYESAITADLRRSGFTVYIIPMDDDPTLRALQTTVGLIQAEKIDLLHAHLPRGHALAGLAGRLTNRPVVATVHGMDLMDDLSIHQLTGTNLIVICQTAYMQALALSIPQEKVTLIRNGVDLKRFKPRKKENCFRQTVGIPADAPLVGFVGRLSWEKGPDQFIRAAGAVHQKRPDVHFVLVGEGPMRDDLARMINEKGLSKTVHLAGLWTETEKVYPALDVLVQTSRREGMPLVLLEAMACGRPVVCMGVGGVLEIVETGTTGLLVSPGDSEGVARNLLHLLSSPEQQQQMGLNGRRRAESLFDLKTTVAYTEILFGRLAGVGLKWQTVELAEQSL